MASTCRALSNLVLRQAACRLSFDTLCKVSAGASGVPAYLLAPQMVPAAVVWDLPSPTSVMGLVQEQYAMYDQDATYPYPAESINILVPLQISRFACDPASPVLCSSARRFAALESRMPVVEPDSVIYLNYKPSISDTAISSLASCSALYKLGGFAPAMSANLSALNVLSHPRGRTVLFSSLGRPYFGRRMICTSEAKGDLSNFEEFVELYKVDRDKVFRGLGHIITQLDAMKKEHGFLEQKISHEPDCFKRWMMDTFKLSDSQFECIQIASTASRHAFSFLTFGSLVVFGTITVVENEIPVGDYFDLANCVRVQALEKGIECYRRKKTENEKVAMFKAAQDAAVKKAVKESAAEKVAKVAQAAALRSAKVQQARDVRKQAGALRKAKVKETQAAKLAEWKQANATRKEAALARKAKAELAAAAIKAKADQASAARKAKADQLAAAVAAARKAKADKAAAAAAARKAKAAKDAAAAAAKAAKDAAAADAKSDKKDEGEGTGGNGGIDGGV